MFPVPFLPEPSKLTDVFESAGATLTSSPVTAEVGGALSLGVVDSVSTDYFRTLNIAPFAGRLIDASDLADSPAAAHVVVLGHRFWQRHYTGDPTIVGRDVRIENLSFRVIGIAPPQYFGLRVEVATDLTIPIGAYLRAEGSHGGPRPNGGGHGGRGAAAGGCWSQRRLLAVSTRSGPGLSGRRSRRRWIVRVRTPF